MIRIAGPARNLLRTRAREAKVRALSAGVETVYVRFAFLDGAEQLAVEMDYPGWQILRDRINQAFVLEG